MSRCCSVVAWLLHAQAKVGFLQFDFGLQAGNVFWRSSAVFGFFILLNQAPIMADKRGA
jgi:hypothetical protein